MNTTNINENTTVAQNADGTKTVTVTKAPMTAADKLRAKLKATAPTSNSEKPITVKTWLEALSNPATIDKFFEGELNGNPEPPLVILTSHGHVNRSECLKAANAAARLADIAARAAAKYGLTIPEAIRLIAKLTIQDFKPADLEAEPEAPQQPIQQEEEKKDTQDEAPAQETPAPEQKAAHTQKKATGKK